MNSDQKEAMRDEANALLARGENLKHAVAFGLKNGKKNMIVDLDVLSVILRGHVPVGNNELPPEVLTERLYAVKAERDNAKRLLAKLVTERGAIVSSADCSPMELTFAKVEGRFYVDSDGMGFVVRMRQWRENAEAALENVADLHRREHHGGVE